MRNAIQRIVNNVKHPFQAVARWANKPSKPGPTAKRYNALKNWANNHIPIAAKQAREAEHRRKEKLRRANDLAQNISHLWAERKRVDKQIEDENRSKKPSKATIKRLQDRKEDIYKRIQQYDNQRDAARKAAGKAKENRQHAWERRKGWVKHRTIYRRRWKAAKKRARDSGGKDVKFESWMGNGHNTSCLPANVKRYIAVGVVVYDQVVTSTTGGTHAPGSWHYVCQAVDMAGPYSGMINHQAWGASNLGSQCLELFGPDGYYYKYGNRIGGAFPAHGDHTHYADN